MRIEQLEYIAAVTQHGSLRRASEQLHISQPALSEAITKLERELGVTLLDRRRAGARISREGQELLPYMADVLEAVEKLRLAAGVQSTGVGSVRVGTVQAGTSTVLLPTLRRFGDEHPRTSVEVRTMLHEDIYLALAEGTIDVGLVNLLSGDDLPPTVEGSVLIQGRPVVVLPAGHRLASRAEVTVEELRAEPFVGMRAGYLMYRFAHRVFGTDLPDHWHATDGAEMGKMMVSEGMGLTLLPDYSVAGDPRETSGQITMRPLAGDRSRVRMLAVQRHNSRTSSGARTLLELLAETAVEAQASAGS
ncbi:DNA-binding transcriptional LysR family regulator [Nocardioides luteus]|uniref:LysR family transcriptional regulator n=1 Tax=Nocardioides luteus TaxID=1844 RepID=A0ABQ5SZG5_9ACTN|nr:LysR family transcriptional regulator [Nocardioides luteus]MDR7312064.1 DNA-binding transcriptional LysR family regulator [Nocardioides luteus]GGR72331.1 LysR family transcriptional regulator [Nocardioides luteus]GLJ68311.1 LysR family transcriptional regulator [Nocardioides luteus]